MDIWAECKDRFSFTTVANELIRVVESQEQAATNRLVDNLEEQDLLEQMLEASKPLLSESISKLHYLLFTPFRYPPLAYGSRFGTRFEPSLFYGSLTLTTAFAETGYYRFLFWLGMQQPPKTGKFVTQHTVFAVPYQTAKGARLQDPPFDHYRVHLTDRSHYVDTQQLGSALRGKGVEAFEYISARDSDAGVNVALFHAKALAASQPAYQQSWLCEINQESVSFYSHSNSAVHRYTRASYEYQGYFPAPAL